jgi:hypothetical protein
MDRWFQIMANTVILTIFLLLVVLTQFAKEFENLIFSFMLLLFINVGLNIINLNVTLGLPLSLLISSNGLGVL